MTIRTFLTTVAVCLIAGSFATAQTEEKFDFYTRGEYRTTVPRPQTILRFDVGDHHTTYAQMEKVIDEIAKAASDRVRVFDIGLTNEHRMQHLVAISSPANIARLDEIKTRNNRLTDPRTTTATEASTIAQSNPLITWLAYTIHGNESASFEAMMQVVYQLAASNEPKTVEILDNTVVLILTGENPDGHERFVTWYNSVATGNADRASLEHREPWSVHGRFNHYRFDLNRDNAAATQVETRNMQTAFFEWNPQVVVDHHGQPSQYHFPPAALPINPNLPQPSTNKWLDTFGRANATAFDSNKWDYYVRDIFDLFYVGYWDSFPSLNGATGMTYETDGGGFKGRRWTRDDGTIVTLRSAIAKHFVASMTTLETAAKNRAARLQDYADFRRRAIDEVKNERMKRIIIDPAKDPLKAAELVEVLLRMKIDVGVTTADMNSQRAHSYDQKNGIATSRTCPVGCYVIDLAQPQKRLIKALLEPHTQQDEAFIREEVARFQRNERRGKSASKEDYRFYDITAWSLPLAFGLDAFWTEDPSAVPQTAVTAETIKRIRAGSVTGRASIAYIIPYTTDAAAAMAMRLLQSGHRVAVSTKPLNAGGRNYPRGSFVVRISRNTDRIHDTINRFATELGTTVVAVNTGYNDEGDTGVGAETVISLKNPAIAMIADEAVDQTSYGSIWWTFNRYGIEFTPLTLANARGVTLSKYNVLIMPDGSASRYFSSLGASGVAALKTWIANGGTLVTVRGASVFAALKDVGLTSTKLVGSDDDEEKGKAADDTDRRKDAEAKPSPTPRATPSTDASVEPGPQDQRTDKQDWQAPALPAIASPSANAGKVPEGVPGAIMRATVDRTTYLTYGLEQNELPVLLSSGYFFRYSKEGTNALVFDANPRSPLTISGFVWEGNTERLLKGTSYLIDEPTGSGHVILFAEEPFFRGIYRSATRPFLNSLLFTGVF
ncbi:MAG TPA: M14 family zinc carboxypeptidase [Pyrinomonadaceae bacterium]|nr:M14 family zinc carboxypeptidase [Pyrinomonadaceae bacterium]